MTNNQNKQPIQCHYAVSKKFINTVSTDTNVESPQFPISLKIKDNYFRVQLENDLHLSVSCHEFENKAQPLEHVHQNKIQQFTHNHLLPETYAIIQHTDVTLNTNKT